MSDLVPRPTPLSRRRKRPRAENPDNANGQKSAPFRISRHDLLPILCNVVLALIGLVLLPSKADVGIVTVAFFGSGAYFLGLLQWRKYAEHKLKLTSVEVVGGARIYPKRSFMVLMGLWLLILGFVFIVFGGSYPAMFRWIGGFVAVCGFVVAVLAALRLHPAGFLQFEPEGLIIGQRGWRVMVPWDKIEDVDVTELSNNPVIRLGVYDRQNLVITPASAEAKARTIMSKGSTLFSWGPFFIFPMHYGIPTRILASAIRHYAHDNVARRKLGDRQLVAPASV
jgi:hypothetical protein